MHDGAGERRVGAGLQHQPHIRLLDRRIVVDVDDDDLGAAFLARLDRMGHHVDLGRDRIGAPDDHAIGFRHLARIGTAQRTGRHRQPGPGEVGADRAEKAGIALGMTQALDRIALHLPHRAGVEIGPDGFGAVRCSALTKASAISSSASLPGTSCQLPSPFAPLRRCGTIRRPG